MRTTKTNRNLTAVRIAAIAFAVSVQVGSAQTTNITATLSNPSFDSPVVPAWTTGVPNGWNGGGDSSEFGLGPVYHDGAQGMFFNFGGSWRSVSQNSSYAVQQAGEVLNVSTWIKVDNHAGAPNVVWFNEQIIIGGSVANQVQPAYTASADWAQVSVSYTALAADVGKTVGVALGFQSDGWAQTFADQVTLTTTLVPQVPLRTWNNGAGTFVWNTTDANWSGSTWNNAIAAGALFGAAGAGSVSVAVPITAESVTINSAGYTLADGGGTLEVKGAITNNVDTTLSAMLVGGLTLEGSGNLATDQQQIYTGSTVINGGSLTLSGFGGLYYSGGGPIRINTGGTLSMSSGVGYSSTAIKNISPGAGSVIINGGTWQHTGASNAKWDQPGSGRNFTIGAQGATLESATAGAEFSLGYRYDYDAPGVIGATAGGTLTLSGEGDGDLNYRLQGTGGLTMQGAGTWKLSNATTYGGDTVIMAGTLALANGVDLLPGKGQGQGSITSPSIILSNGASFDVSLAAGGFTLALTQSLFGDGSVLGVFNAAAGSRIYPGLDGTYGTCSFSNGLVLASGALCYMDVGTSATGSNDRIVVGGNLNLGSAVFHLKAPSTSAILDTTSDYVLMQVAGTISGSPVATPVWEVAPVNVASLRVLVVGKTVVLRDVTGTPPSAVGSANPSTVSHFDKVILSVTVTPGSAPITSVVSSAGWIEGSPVTLLPAGPNVYTNAVVVGVSAPLGANYAVVTATDTSFLSGVANIPITVVAANRVWSGLGADDNWSSSPNWLAGKIPGIGDTASFAGATRLTPSMNSNQSLTGMALDPTAGAFNIGTVASTLTLAGSGIVKNSTNTQTLSMPIVLAESQVINAAAGDLVMGGKLSGAAGYVKNGSGGLTLSGQSEYAGATTINGGKVTIADGAKLYLNGGGPVTINSGSALSLPGGTDISWGGCLHFLPPYADSMFINGGTLQHRGPGNRQADAGAGHGFTIGALGASLDSAAAGETFSVGFWPGVTIDSPAGGTLTLTGDGDGVLDFAVPGSGGLAKGGSGTWTLTKANTYTGTTRVEGGTLVLKSATLAAGSTVVIKTNAVLNLNFSGANTVGALILGTMPMPPGTYDASTASGFISGAGSLLVSGYPHPQISYSVSGNSMILSWSEDYSGWSLQTQTNSLATGLSTNWHTVPGSSGVTTISQPVVPANPSVFYRLKY